MKTVSLSGSPRENVGKKDAKLLRAAGNVPCVIYGGENQVHFHLSEIDLKKVVYTPDVFQLDLTVGSDGYKAIIQELQFHPVTDQILHADFLQLFDDKEVIVSIPVRYIGQAPGVLNGGRLATLFKTLRVKGLPSAIPECIEIDISEMIIGDSMKIGELERDGLKFLDAHTSNVVAVKMARAALVELELEPEEGEEGEEGAEGAEGATPGEGGDAPAAEGGDAPKAEGGGDDAKE